LRADEERQGNGTDERDREAKVAAVVAAWWRWRRRRRLEAF
jgi:hypothetical protein